MTSGYDVRLAPPARRALATILPEKVAAAATEFITGALAEAPHRVGKPLLAPLVPKWVARRGDYRILYTIDDARHEVIVATVLHRRDTCHSS